MDDEHFDRIARRFAVRLDAFRRGEGDEPSHDSGGALPRRDALRLIGAGAWAAVSAVLARPLPASAEVTASAGRRCVYDHNCGPKQKCFGNGRKARCKCVGNSPRYLDECGTNCTNFLIDDGNCGGCAKKCTPGATTCVEGTCVEGNVPSNNCNEQDGGPGCPDGSVCCGGGGDPEFPEIPTCRNLQRDKNHCGACYRACTAGKQPACCFGRCRDLHADPLNCGRCWNRCPKDKPICSGSGGNSGAKCREKCPPGLTKCGRTCFQQSTEACCNGKVIAKEDMQFNDKICGECGRDCTTWAVKSYCCGGDCCQNVNGCCSGQCTNLSLNDAHCGECGNACGSKEWCRFGECQCRPGETCP